MAKPRPLPSAPHIAPPEPDDFLSSAPGARPPRPEPRSAPPESPYQAALASLRSTPRVAISVRLPDDLYQEARDLSRFTSIALTAMIERGLALEVARIRELYQRKTGEPVPSHAHVDLLDAYRDSWNG